MANAKHGSVPRHRGRPQKYGRPSQVVAVTLPTQVVTALRRHHTDIGWAIVDLVEHNAPARPSPGRVEAPTLVEVADGQSLIVVSPRLVRSLPTVQGVLLSETQAFLALEPGCGMADLELAVLDRIERLRPGAERRALQEMAKQLKRWRLDGRLRFSTRSIILVTQQQDATPAPKVSTATGSLRRTRRSKDTS